MKKRFLSLTLAVILSLGMLPAALAAGTDFFVENGVLDTYMGSDSRVVVPDGVSAIAQTAFTSPGITEIVLPDSVTELAKFTFMNCPNLERVVLGAGVRVIPEGAFYGCGRLREVVLPDGLAAIEKTAFYECSGLTRLDLPDSVVTLGDYAFYGCAGLTDLTLGRGLSSLGRYVFGSCTGLTSVTVPGNIRYVGDYAFAGCDSLSQVTLAAGTVYGVKAFQRCGSLPAEYSDELKYPYPVEQVGDFRIRNGVLVKYTGAGGAVTVPDGVVAIGEHAFNGCTAVTEVDLGEAVSIGYYAFAGCTGLEKLTLGEAWIAVDDTSFRNCGSLRELVFPAESRMSAVPRCFDQLMDAFWGCSSLERIVNCPDQAAYERLAANERITAAWMGAGPGRAVTPQSQRITDLSNQICAGLASDYDKVRAVYDWVTANIEYDYAYYNGQKQEVSVYPEEVLDSRLTVCDGYARLTQALLQAQGIPALRVVGPANGARGWEDHAWNLAYVEGRWIYLETTWGSPSGGNGANSTRGETSWFDTGAMYLSLTHEGTSSHVDPNSYSVDDTPEPAEIKVGGFSDVSETDYYAQSVLWAVEKGITTGTSDTTFSPDITCTTAQILTFLWRASGSPAVTADNSLTDVKQSDYYYQAAQWAKSLGMIDGPALSPDTPCTRASTILFMWQAAGCPDATTEVSFTDIPAGSDYAMAVAWAVEKDVTSGTSATTFSPDMTCTRAQIVTLLYRAAA